jgi:hypothetical protein
VPVEGFKQETKKITLPSRLNPDEWMYTSVKDVGKLKHLLIKLSRSGVQRTKDGLVGDNDETANVDYDQTIISACNGRFFIAFEKMYSIMRKHGIIF